MYLGFDRIADAGALIIVGILVVPLVFLVGLRQPFLALGAYVAFIGALPRARILISALNIPLYLIDITLGCVLAILILRTIMKEPVHRIKTPVDSLVIAFTVLVLPSILVAMIRWPNQIIELTFFTGIIFYTFLFISMWTIFQGVPILKTYGEWLTQFHNDIFSTTSSLSINTTYGLNRANASYNTANDLSGYLSVMLLVISFAFTSANAPKTKIHPYLVIGLGVAALFFTYSRTGWIASAAGFTVAGMFSYRNLIISILRRLPLVILVTFVGILALALFTPNAVRLAAERGGELFTSPTEIKNLQPRLEGHTRFYNHIIDRPETLLWGDSLRQADLAARGLIIYTADGFVSNSWLLVILDLGLLAFLAYVLIYLFTIFRLFWAINSTHTNDNYRFIMTGLIAALVSVAFAHLGDNYYGVQIGMRGFLFMIIGLSHVVIGLSRSSSDAEISDKSEFFGPTRLSETHQGRD
jgi:hypothetical protein